MIIFSRWRGTLPGDERILQSLDKNIVLENVNRAVELLNKENITVIAAFMIGAPGDDAKTIQKSIDYANSLKSIAPIILHLTTLTPYPGTRLTAQMQQAGLIQNQDWINYDPHSAPPIKTHNLDSSELQKLAEEFMLSFYSLEYITKLRNLKLHHWVAEGFIANAEQIRAQRRKNIKDVTSLLETKREKMSLFLEQAI